MTSFAQILRAGTEIATWHWTPMFRKNKVFFSDTSRDEVARTSQKLKIEKSSGYDGTSNEILNFSPVVEEHLFEASHDPMSTSKENFFKLPENNQGKRSEFRDPENYRATSLLSSLSKILGKIYAIGRLKGFYKIFFSLLSSSALVLGILVFMRLAK